MDLLDAATLCVHVCARLGWQVSRTITPNHCYLQITGEPNPGVTTGLAGLSAKRAPSGAGTNLNCDDFSIEPNAGNNVDGVDDVGHATHMAVVKAEGNSNYDILDESLPDNSAAAAYQPCTAAQDALISGVWNYIGHRAEHFYCAFKSMMVKVWLSRLLRVQGCEMIIEALTAVPCCS